MGDPTAVWTTAAFADRIARAAEIDFTQNSGVTGEGTAVVGQMIYHSVLRAFGCICRHDPNKDDQPVCFEDIVCPLHGLGPLTLPSDGQCRADPGE